MIFSYLQCKIFGHNLVESKQCPFTGTKYNKCTRCDIRVAIW